MFVCKSTSQTLFFIFLHDSNLVCFLNCILSILYPRIIDQCFVYFLIILFFLIDLELPSHPGWSLSHKLLSICILDTLPGVICNLLLVQTMPCLDFVHQWWITDIRVNTPPTIWQVIHKSLSPIEENEKQKRKVKVKKYNLKNELYIFTLYNKCYLM